MSKRWELGAYELTDTNNGNVYKTGVSLADCTIPFEDLLNRESQYAEYYRTKVHLQKHEIEDLKEDLRETESKLVKLDDWLLEEFSMDVDDVIEAMR